MKKAHKPSDKWIFKDLLVGTIEISKRDYPDLNDATIAAGKLKTEQITVEIGSSWVLIIW